MQDLEPKMCITPLIETEELAELLGKPHVRIIDASWYIPPTTRDAFAEFQTRHIPGAVFFDIDAISDTQFSLPHMLPSAEFFAQKVGEMGIDNESLVIVYDGHGVMSAPRVWWMFRFFGHEQVAVLNGGLPKWEREARLLESGMPKATTAAFSSNPNPSLLANWQSIQDGLLQKNDPSQVLDMRSTGRFNGLESEPRAGLRSGHIPSSINLPWTSFLHPEEKTLLSATTLKARFNESGLNPEDVTICSCGSGITACVGLLALAVVGNEKASVYDGSWAEWGSRNDLPIESALSTI
jgi:thiosulfate/3-mercaptopyruvate sulfurtransferase